MRKLASLTLSLFLLSGTAFADSPKDSPKDSTKDAQPAKTAAATETKTNAEIAAQLEELRQAMQAQQEQLQMLKEELAKRDRQIEEAREAAAAANSRATEANSKASEAAATSAEVKSTAATLNTTVSTMAAGKAAVVNSTAASPGGQQKDEEKGPTTIRFKGVNITPGGFIEAATVTRQRAESADINTQFNGIPYPNNAVGKQTETNFSARQSRLTLLVDTKIGDTKLSGYYEADFLGAGTTSNNRESNSYVYRQRQLFARADFANGLAFSAGQMWSLATENRKGIVNRNEWLPMMVDPQYVVGFSWQRADSIRVSKSFGDKLTLGASVEGSQETLGGRGFSTFTSFNTGTGATTTSQNFYAFAPGNSGGLYNAFDPTGYSLNKTPDFIFKAALDPGWGHYEVYGIVSTFRNRVYPCAVVGTTGGNIPTPVSPVVLGCSQSASLNPSVAGASNESITEGGGGFHFHGPLFAKKLDVGLSGAYGVGEGRFYAAQLPDVTARPDGTLTPIHNASWLGSLEWHVTPKFDLYGYVGGEYAGRAAYTGYHSVKVTITPAIPGCGNGAVVPGQPNCGGGAPPGTIQFPVPAQSTTTISTSGIGGYGSPFANNTGCSTETLPSGNSAPGGGGACAGDTRYIGEATLGFWHKLYQGEKGRAQWGIVYSYFYKTGWSGNNNVATNPSVSPHAVDNMVWTAFRYYLP